MRLILFFCFLFISIEEHAQQLSINKITIIGVRHYGNKNFNGDTLYNILDNINPNIIFNEGPLKKNFSFLTTMLISLKNSRQSIEEYATTKYANKNLNAELLEIDINFSLYERSKYYSYVTNYGKALSKNINRIYNLKETPDSVKHIIMKYVTPLNYYNKIIDTNRLEILNRPNIIDSCRSSYNAYENYLLPIINSYPEFSRISKRANTEFAIWGKRNKTMAEKILNRLKNNTFNSPLVIICGINHKYALEDLLKSEEKKYNFKIYDFWELYK